MRHILSYLLRLLAIVSLLYLIIGLAIATLYITLLDPNSACDITNVIGLILTWPLFVAMAIIFWFAAG